MGEDGLKEKLDKENLKRMHNICPTLPHPPPSPTVTALSKEISLDYGRTVSIPNNTSNSIRVCMGD